MVETEKNANTRSDSDSSGSNVSGNDDEQHDDVYEELESGTSRGNDSSDDASDADDNDGWSENQSYDSSSSSSDSSSYESSTTDERIDVDDNDDNHLDEEKDLINNCGAINNDVHSSQNDQRSSSASRNVRDRPYQGLSEASSRPVVVMNHGVNIKPLVQHYLKKRSLIHNNDNRYTLDNNGRTLSHNQNTHKQPPKPQHDKSHRHRHNHKRSQTIPEHHQRQRRWSQLVTIDVIFLFSATLWIIAQARFFFFSSSSSSFHNPFRRRRRRTLDDQHQRIGHIPDHYIQKLSPDQIRLKREQRKMESLRALGDAAGEYFHGNNYRRKKMSRKKGGGKAETIPAGCAAAVWHNLSLPDCNNIHEIDLGMALGMKRFGEKLPDFYGENHRHRRQQTLPNNGTLSSQETDNGGYVGSGYWRNVWKLIPLFPERATVLKMMKMEHDVDERNFDRHRRDALVMERLTSNPYIVPIFGFCGNSVLSDFIGDQFDEYIFPQEGNDNDNGKGKRGQSSLPPPSSSSSSVISRETTPLQRLQLALDAARGLLALHSIPGGPIIHADIQAKQFLVMTTTTTTDSTAAPHNNNNNNNTAAIHKQKSYRILLNDFNRCRFIPTHIETKRPCPLRIPSAPGGWRSPEEYNKGNVTEKLDVFSFGHVLYGILTGQRPFDTNNGRNSIMIKNTVKEGVFPKIPERFLKNHHHKGGGGDAGLARLVERVYVFDKDERISMSELVSELEKLIEEEKKRMGREE